MTAFGRRQGDNDLARPGRQIREFDNGQRGDPRRGFALERQPDDVA